MSRRKRYTRNLGRKLKTPLPVRTTAEWVRFEHEHEPYGVFSYVNEAREALSRQLVDELNAVVSWFSDHLHAPDILTVERFWFRAEATEHLARAHRLAASLRVAGIPVVERRTKRIPGRVRWEDDHQVAVLTYRDAPQPPR